MKANQYKHKWGRMGVLAASATLAGVLLLGGCGVATLTDPAQANQSTTTTQEVAEAETTTETAVATDASGVHFDLATAATLPSSDSKTALSTTEIYKTASPSVVAISSTAVTTNFFGQTAETPSAGSGVVISADGYILTCNHVIEGMKDIKVVTDDDKTYDAELIGGDKRTDLAVLKIDATGLQPIALGDSDELQVGELAVAIGNPLGEFANSMSMGIISGTDREINIEGESMNLLQTDASISPGNSGGALINSYGELIGITNAKSSGTAVEGVGLAIPVNDAKEVVNQLVNTGHVSRPQLSITGGTVTDEMRSYLASQGYQGTIPDGVLINSVVEGGAADTAGLKAYDVITQVNGKDVASIEELKELIDASAIGDKLTFTVWRDGETSSIIVTLADAPQESATPEPTPTQNDDLSGYLQEYFN